jgi:hypothetical protein
MLSSCNKAYVFIVLKQTTKNPSAARKKKVEEMTKELK